MFKFQIAKNRYNDSFMSHFKRTVFEPINVLSRSEATTQGLPFRKNQGRPVRVVHCAQSLERGLPQNVDRANKHQSGVVVLLNLVTAWLVRQELVCL